MKNFFYFFIAFVFSGICLFSKTKTKFKSNSNNTANFWEIQDPTPLNKSTVTQIQKEKINNYLSTTKTLGFQENKGQISDENRNPLMPENVYWEGCGGEVDL